MVSLTGAIAETPTLLQLPLDSLAPDVRKKIEHCQADIAAGLEGRPLPFAKPGRLETRSDGSVERDPKGDPVIGSLGITDGGTTFWHGEGYVIVIHHTDWGIRNVSGTLVGVSVEFSKDLVGHERVPPVWPPVSFVRFVADKDANQIPASTHDGAVHH